MRVRLPYVALACLLAVSGCGGSDDPATSGQAVGASAGGSASPSAPAAGTDEPGTTIPDDFPLSAGMGGPGDTIPTARSGTGLRGLALCGETPMRGLTVRDRMVADNSGGEAADTRELVLLGSTEEALEVAQSFRDLAEHCDRPPSGSSRTRTDVLVSPLEPWPASALQQTYAFDGRPVDGSVLVHVVPVGAALLVTSTYGGWTRTQGDEAAAETAAPLGETVAALAQFDDGSRS